MKSNANTSILTLLFIVIICLFSSCQSDQRKVHLSESERINIKIVRYDSILTHLNTTNLQSEIKHISSLDNTFFNVFFSEILDFGSVDSTRIYKALNLYLKDTLFHNVNRDEMIKYRNISDIESETSEAFSIFHHEFPNIKLPKIYFFVSGFNRSVYYNNNLIAIGADMYMGKDYPYYEGVAYKYMKYNMERKFIATDIVMALLSQNFTFNSDKNRLLDQMLYKGKLLYISSQLLPNRNDSDIVGYTTEQANWCNKYEKEIWATIIDQKDLFSTDAQLIRKYIGVAPFTSPISQESPGRLGEWIGLKIIQSYMKNNKNIKIQDLVKSNDYQQILQNSNYKP